MPAPSYISSGSYASGGAWPGDPRIVFPDTRKLGALGWGVALHSEAAVRKGAKDALSCVMSARGPAKDSSVHWTIHQRGTGMEPPADSRVGA